MTTLHVSGGVIVVHKFLVELIQKLLIDPGDNIPFLLQGHRLDSFNSIQESVVRHI